VAGRPGPPIIGSSTGTGLAQPGWVRCGEPAST